jgi:hypothetical protein
MRWDPRLTLCCAALALLMLTPLERAEAQDRSRPQQVPDSSTAGAHQPAERLVRSGGEALIVRRWREEFAARPPKPNRLQGAAGRRGPGGSPVEVDLAAVQRLLELAARAPAEEAAGNRALAPPAGADALRRLLEAAEPEWSGGSPFLHPGLKAAMERVHHRETPAGPR